MKVAILKAVLLISIIILPFISWSQNVAITDDNGYSADPSAMLDVKSNTKGMLVPRVTTIQRNAIVSPANGLLVFDINEGNFYFHNGTSWISLTSSTNSIWTKTGQDVHLSTGTDNVGVGTNTPLGKLEVKGDIPVNSNDPLFEVINSNGDTVFAVFSQGVQIRVADDPIVKAAASKSGFAVGGFSLTKGLTNEYLRVTPDSVRVYVESGSSKAVASKGGFAVGGFSLTKGLTNEYLRVTDDSVRVYIDKNGGNKASGSKGGFAVGGFSLTKSTPDDYFNISGADSAEVIDPAEARIVWYPTKEAFLSGKVLIESVDSVGKNSMATGFESKSIGDYSQAFGYRARSFGNNSTAIGNYAEAIGNSSFAFGDSALAIGMGSCAIGSVGRDTVSGLSYGDAAIALGNYSYAFGNGDSALANYAFAIGTGVVASGVGATGIGFQASSRGYMATAIGANSTAFGNKSATLGSACYAGSSYALAMGSNTTASGYNSTAMGYKTTSSGYYSYSLGMFTTSQPYLSFVHGRYNVISGSLTGWVATDPLFVLGNGSSDAARSNAMVVYKNGNTEINGNFTFNAGANSVTLPGNRGTNGYVLTTNGAGSSSWAATVGDNLGNHAATQNLDMNNYNIIDVGSIGIGTSSPSSNLHIYNIGDATFTLQADYNNVGENDNPRFEMKQDGTLITGGIGYVGDAGLLFTNSISNGMYMVNDYNSPLQFGTNNIARMTIGSGGSVGIGTIAPTDLLHIENSAGASSLKVRGATAYKSSLKLFESGDYGFEFEYDGSTDDFNLWSRAFSGNEAIRMTWKKDGKVGIGVTAPTHSFTVYAPGTETMRLYADGPNGASARLNWGDGDFVYIGEPTDDRMRIQATRVGLRRDPTANSFEVEGTAAKTTAGDWAANSDKRIKTDIRDIDNSIELIKQLRPVKFKYSEEWCKKHPSIKDKYYYNFIAQEYGKIFPESVKGSGEYLDGDKEEILQIDTYNAQIIAIKAVQELIIKQEQLTEELKLKTRELDELKRENNEIKAMNTSLKDKIEEDNQNLKTEIAKIKEIVMATADNK